MKGYLRLSHEAYHAYCAGRALSLRNHWMIRAREYPADDTAKRVCVKWARGYQREYLAELRLAECARQREHA